MEEKDWLPWCHAVIRAKERYGVELHGYDLRAMRNYIESGKATYISTCRGPSAAWRRYLVYCHKIGHHVPVVYNHDNRFIMTILKLEHIIAGCDDSDD